MEQRKPEERVVLLIYSCSIILDYSQAGRRRNLNRVYVLCTCLCVGVQTEEPAVFANSWSVDLPHERGCPLVDIDFTGPCHSESDMDVRPVCLSVWNPVA